MIAIVITIVIVYFLFKALFARGYKVKAGPLSKLILQLEETRTEGYVSIKDRKYLLGKVGYVVTPLRPIGTVMIENEKVDASSEGDSWTRNEGRSYRGRWNEDRGKSITGRLKGVV